LNVDVPWYYEGITAGPAAAVGVATSTDGRSFGLHHRDRWIVPGGSSRLQGRRRHQYIRLETHLPGFRRPRAALRHEQVAARALRLFRSDLLARAKSSLTDPSPQISSESATSS